MSPITAFHSFLRLTLGFALAGFITLTASAQLEIDYPYNPDANGDEIIGAEDLLSLLSTFGMEFQLDSIYIDNLTLEALLADLPACPRCRHPPRESRRRAHDAQRRQRQLPQPV